jgi:molybdopterin-containing oxidoreductase family membrane subunit
MASEKRVMSLFQDESLAVSAIDALRERPWKLEEVHSPIPSEKILHALKRKKSRVGYFTLAGGVIGFLSGIGLAIYTGVQWNLVVSGKPVVALIPFLIVGFEFTILFAVFGNVLGLLLQTNLPEFKSLRFYDQRCSGDHFGLLVSCAPGQENDLMAFFHEQGGEARVI